MGLWQSGAQGYNVTAHLPGNSAQLLEGQISLDDLAAWKASGALPQNVNYAVKGNLVRDFLREALGSSGKLKAPRTTRDPETASTAERAAVLVIAE